MMEERYVSISEVKNILKRIQKERKELTYEQKIALKHAEAFARLSVTKTKQLIKELLDNIEKIDEKHAYKIADLLPQHEEDVKLIFAKERVNLDDEDIKKILEIVGRYIG
ncbi:MAG TPA: RNA polymerase [Thermoplasmatales archaeon]|nr:RNA polymerase [Thermoplasmatales archaeon]HEX16868.1 RNA polymerase [Thermoplasmatales archaeon]